MLVGCRGPLSWRNFCRLPYCTVAAILLINVCGVGVCIANTFSFDNGFKNTAWVDGGEVQVLVKVKRFLKCFRMLVK